MSSLIQARLFWEYPEGFRYLLPQRAVNPPPEHRSGVPVTVEVLDGELRCGAPWLARVVGFDLTVDREDFVIYLDVALRIDPLVRCPGPGGETACAEGQITRPLPAELLSADAPVRAEERSGMIDWGLVLYDWHNTTLLLSSPDHPLRAAYQPDPQQVCAGRFYNRRGRKPLHGPPFEN